MHLVSLKDSIPKVFSCDRFHCTYVRTYVSHTMCSSVLVNYSFPSTYIASGLYSRISPPPTHSLPNFLLPLLLRNWAVGPVQSQWELLSPSCQMTVNKGTVTSQHILPSQVDLTDSSHWHVLKVHRSQSWIIWCMHVHYNVMLTWIACISVCTVLVWLATLSHIYTSPNIFVCLCGAG